LNLVGRQIGNYIAKEQIGAGGMGVVYLAEHPLIGRKVALKVLHPELAIDEQMVQRLWLEAKSASEIDSEHVVQVLDFGRMPLGTSAGETIETVYLAMELLEGQSLADRFWEQGLSFRDAVDITRQTCRALQASHDKGVVHRDLKPENLFLVRSEERRNFVKILDFGIAKMLSNPYTRTRTGVLLGTPAYMSPEQCRGSGDVDHRSDIYSLGIMLYELTSGVLPFAAQGYGDVIMAHMTRAPEPPTTHNPKIPPKLEAAILRALEKKPQDRFQSMFELGSLLAGVAEELDQAVAEQVRAHASSDRTTQRGLGAPEQRTLLDPPSAVPQGDVHERPTQALATDAVHQRETVMLRGSVHEQTTKLKELESPPSELNQRLAGVSLRDVLGSTSAVEKLKTELQARGAPQPIAPTNKPGPPAPARRIEPRIVLIAIAVVVVSVVLFLLSRGR
jgi:eukaryotic-like serine/threonine-protein kinase